MHYLILGAGGVGGSLAVRLAQAGNRVDLVAHGAHLDAIRQDGLTLIEDGGSTTVRLPAATAEDYNGSPDVVFVCVKGYALQSIIPCLQRIASERTVVIPLLNIYGTGSRLQRSLPGTLVTDGCIYITAEISAPATILHRGSIFRVVFGCREGANPPILAAVASELAQAGIEPLLSDDIRRDTFLKYTYISPVAATGLFHHASAGCFTPGSRVEATFLALSRELGEIAKVAGISLPPDFAEQNLAICRSLDPAMLTSVQRDYYAGKSSELDGLVFEPVRRAAQYGVRVPKYQEIAAVFGFTQY